MGWEWRAFYNIRSESNSASFSPTTPLLNLGQLLPDNDPRTDEYFLLDFPTAESASLEGAAEVDADSAEETIKMASTPYDVGLKLRGGARAGLEIKCCVARKPNLRCEKWKKVTLSPDVELPVGGWVAVGNGPDDRARLLRDNYSTSLSKLLPLQQVKVNGVAKITKQRSQRNDGAVLVEHTLVRLESDAMPGVVVLAESLGLDAKKDALKDYIKSGGVREAAEKANAMVMGYPELLHKLFVSRELRV